MSAYAPLLAALVALLVGLTVGKAWERYKLRDGKWIDRRRARESPHYILGLNFLVANQIDLAIEELSKAASLDADALEVHMILGNLYREKGPGRQGDHRAPEPAAAAEAEQARARLRAALPRARLQARRLRRSRARGVQRGAAARSEERVRAASTCRSCTKSSISGPRRTTRGSGWRSSPTSTRGRRTRRFSRSSKTRSASRRCAARTTRRRSGASKRPSTSTPARCRPTSTSATCASPQGNEREAAAIWEKLIDVAPDRAYLAFDRLEALAIRTGNPGPLHAAVPPPDRREPAGLARAARAVASPGGERPAARGARSAVRGARPEPARAQHPPGDLARARPAAPPAGARRSLQRAHAARRLLPRSARLHALPLPQHRAALAMSALPRLEHLRRRAHRAGAGPDRSRSLTTKHTKRSLNRREIRTIARVVVMPVSAR